MTEKEYMLHQDVKLWNIIASLFFVFLCLAMYVVFLILRPEPFEVDIFDILVLSLANYRLIRLFVYDNMTLFLREMFMDLKIEEGTYSYVASDNSFKHTMHKLSTCPWCFGVWLSFVTSFLYFTFPFMQMPFVILGISGIASFLMIFTNLVGWYAESKKKEVSKMG